MESLNWGIIGPGNIAHDFAHDLELIRPAQKITAVLGHIKENAETFSKEFKVEGVFTDIREFVTHPGINIAYIATPHPHHFEQALACLENNIHVLCEKPLTLNAKQTARLVEASQQHQRFLMEAMWIRFLPSIQKALELIKDNTIGKILSVKASMGYKAPQEHNNRYFDPSLGGGSLLDLGIYPVFLSQLLLGQPSGVKAIGSLTKKGVDESCAMLFDYPGGAHCILESTLLSASERPAEIAGEKGIISILHPWFEKSIGIELKEYEKEKKFYPVEWQGHGLQFEVEEVLRCIQEKKIESDLFSHRFSLQLSETMDEIREQIKLIYKDFE